MIPLFLKTGTFSFHKEYEIIWTRYILILLFCVEHRPILLRHFIRLQLLFCFLSLRSQFSSSRFFHVMVNPHLLFRTFLFFLCICYLNQTIMPPLPLRSLNFFFLLFLFSKSFLYEHGPLWHDQLCDALIGESVWYFQDQVEVQLFGTFPSDVLDVISESRCPAAKQSRSKMKEWVLRRTKVWAEWIFVSDLRQPDAL